MKKRCFRQKAGLPEMKAEIEKDLLRCGINPRIRREQIYSFLNGEKDNLQTNALTHARSKETTLHYPSCRE